MVLTGLTRGLVAVGDVLRDIRPSSSPLLSLNVLCDEPQRDV